MEAILIAVLALALGLGVGFLLGIRFAGGLIGKTLKHEMSEGRLSRDEALRLSNLPGVRS